MVSTLDRKAATTTLRISKRSSERWEAQVVLARLAAEGNDLTTAEASLEEAAREARDGGVVP